VSGAGNGPPMAAELLPAMQCTVTQDANQGYGEREGANIRFAQIAIRFVQDAAVDDSACFGEGLAQCFSGGV